MHRSCASYLAHRTLPTTVLGAKQPRAVFIDQLGVEPSILRKTAQLAESRDISPNDSVHDDCDRHHVDLVTSATPSAPVEEARFCEWRSITTPNAFPESGRT